MKRITMNNMYFIYKIYCCLLFGILFSFTIYEKVFNSYIDLIAVINENQKKIENISQINNIDKENLGKDFTLMCVDDKTFKITQIFTGDSVEPELKEIIIRFINEKEEIYTSERSRISLTKIKEGILILSVPKVSLILKSILFSKFIILFFIVVYIIIIFFLFRTNFINYEFRLKYDLLFIIIFGFLYLMYFIVFFSKGILSFGTFGNFSSSIEFYLFLLQIIAICFFFIKNPSFRILLIFWFSGEFITNIYGIIITKDILKIMNIFIFLIMVITLLIETIELYKRGHIESLMDEENKEKIDNITHKNTD